MNQRRKGDAYVAENCFIVSARRLVINDRYVKGKAIVAS